MKHETEIPSIDDIILVKDAKEIFGIGKVDPKLIWNANIYLLANQGKGLCMYLDVVRFRVYIKELHFL